MGFHSWFLNIGETVVNTEMNMSYNQAENHDFGYLKIYVVLSQIVNNETFSNDVSLHM